MTAAGIDISAVSAPQISAAKTIKHSAALGVLIGSTVEVRDAFDKTETVLYTTQTDSNGEYVINLPNDASYKSYGMFRVTVSGGSDGDVNDTGKRDATPTPFKGSINALVDPNQLLTAPIKVSLLSDMAFRMIGGDLSRFTATTLAGELDRLAKVLLKTSVVTGAAPGASDLLVFDATDLTHRAVLAFDFANLSQPVNPAVDNSSLLDKYHNGAADIVPSVRSVLVGLSGLNPTLAQEMVKASAKLQALVSGTGRITGTELPGGQLERTPQPFATVLPRDGSTVSFTAVETDAAWKFHSWTGCTLAVGTRCDAVMSDDIAVNARFMRATPTVKAEAASLGRITPQDSVTGVRFNSDGSATIVTREAATIAFLNTVGVGSFIQTGQVEHPTVKVTGIVSGPTAVTASAPNANALPSTTFTFNYTEASPTDVYDQITIVADATPVAFDEIRAITIGDGVGGSVRTVMPVPDFTSSVVAGSVLGTTPSWYVTLAADGSSCHGFGADATARAALRAAWEAGPRTYPFDAAALSNCVGLGRFSMGGDLTDYVMAKSLGENDVFSGRNDGTGKLSMRAPASDGDASPVTRYAKGETAVQQGQAVWVSGVGLAIPLGNNLFLAARETQKEGFRVVALQDMVKITTSDALKRAKSDCSMKGLNSACGLLAGLERERQGLRNVGLIPLLSAPLSVTLAKPESKLSATISLNLNIDLKPKASVDVSLSNQSISVDIGADFTVKPELGLTATLGSVGDFKVPATSKKKKFNKANSKAATDKNKTELSKTLITIDVGKAIPYAGAVLDLSLNLVVGVEVGGTLSVTVTPTLTLAGDVGVHAYYEYHVYKSNDRDINAWFNLPTRQPGISTKLTGTLLVEPYAELNFSAGLRGVAPEVAKLYVRGGVEFKGEASTGFSYGTKFRDVKGPDGYAEGKTVANMSKYWADCSAETLYKTPGSCSCTADNVTKLQLPFFGSINVVRSCVPRPAAVLVPGATLSKIPQTCVDSPEIALGVYLHARAGLTTSSSKIKSPFGGWLSFINKDFSLLDKEWPLYEYPEKDDEPEADLAGCKDAK